MRVAQALPPPPPGGRGWAPPLHRLHSSSMLSALGAAPSPAPGAPPSLAWPGLAHGAAHNSAQGAAPVQAPHSAPAALAPESRKRVYQHAMEDGELPGLPPGAIG